MIAVFLAIILDNLQGGSFPFLASGNTNAQPGSFHQPHPKAASTETQSGNNSAPGLATTPSSTRIPMIQLALSRDALSSLLASQVGTQQNTLTDLQVIPTPNNGVIFKVNLQVAMGDTHRAIPIELDSTVRLSAQQDVQFSLHSFKRDGFDAGPTATQNMQAAINQLVQSLLMPSMHNLLKGMKLISVQTSASLCCGLNTEMLVLTLQMN